MFRLLSVVVEKSVVLYKKLFFLFLYKMLIIVFCLICGFFGLIFGLFLWKIFGEVFWIEIDGCNVFWVSLVLCWCLLDGWLVLDCGFLLVWLVVGELFVWFLFVVVLLFWCCSNLVLVDDWFIFMVFLLFGLFWLWEVELLWFMRLILWL